MKPLHKLLAVLVLCALCAHAQGPGICADPVSSIVDHLWKSATEGELLNANGWHRTTGFFLHPDPWPGAKTIRVMSNVWGPASLRQIKGDYAEVEMGYEDAGSIDSELRYIPPKPLYVGNIPVEKTSFLYHLRLAPTHWNKYKSDGKRIDKIMTGPTAWQIEGSQGSPWTTVNTAIRYVLEVRAKTKDATIRKHADQTITELLKWQ